MSVIRAYLREQTSRPFLSAAKAGRTAEWSRTDSNLWLNDLIADREPDDLCEGVQLELAHD